MVAKMVAHVHHAIIRHLMPICYLLHHRLHHLLSPSRLSHHLHRFIIILIITGTRINLFKESICNLHDVTFYIPTLCVCVRACVLDLTNFMSVISRSGSAPGCSPSRAAASGISSHKKSSSVDVTQHNCGKSGKVKSLVRER